MKLIVGLGNPGAEYENTRHNVGFKLIDYLSERWQIDVSRRKFDSRIGQGVVQGESVALMKPQTYMNLSGTSVLGATTFYQLTMNDLLVVLDDMALSPGQLRLRREGTAGGHNGLQNIIECLGRNDFGRLRVGIGSAGIGGAVDHVLGGFKADEHEVIRKSIEQAGQAVECWLKDGIEKAMSRYNTKNTDSEK